MSKPMIKIHDVENDEIIEREMTDAEFAQFEADIEEAKKVAAKATMEAEEKAQLLKRLGLTADEVKLLLS